MIPLPRTVPGVVAMVLHAALGALFMWTGYVKLFGPRGLDGFLDDIRNYHLLSDPWAAWLAMGLPWLEIAAGAAVFTGICAAGGLTVLAGMLSVFLWALHNAHRRGLNIDCGCFGDTQFVNSYADHIRMNGTLLAVSLTLLVWRWVTWKRLQKTSHSAV